MGCALKRFTRKSPSREPMECGVRFIHGQCGIMDHLLYNGARRHQPGMQQYHACGDGGLVGRDYKLALQLVHAEQLERVHIPCCFAGRAIPTMSLDVSLRILGPPVDVDSTRANEKQSQCGGHGTRVYTLPNYFYFKRRIIPYHIYTHHQLDQRN